MRDRGYGGYRGRSPWKTFIKIVVAIVLILAVIAAVAAIYLQRFLVITADGVRLDLPFLQQEQIDEVSPEPVITPEMPVEVVPTPTPEPVIQALVPVELPLEALWDGSAMAQVEAANGDCALFDMKDNNGSLAYVSEVELARYTKQTATDPARNMAISALNEAEGLYTIARVSCFKDHNITNYERSLSIFTNSGYRWTDPDDIRWISPTNPDVRDYLTAICVELAQLGFDEILLDNAGYPAQGNLHYIKKGDAYNQSQFSTVMDGFYAQVADALAEYDVSLSVVTTKQAQSGQDNVTGQTPENLARFARCWTVDETGMLKPENEISPAN